MSRDLMKKIRFLVPGFLFYYLILLPAYTITQIEVYTIQEFIDRLSEYYKVIEPSMLTTHYVLFFIFPGLYHILNLRNILYKSKYDANILNIKEKLIEPYRELYSSEQIKDIMKKQSLMNIFYKFIDNDKSLTERANNIHLTSFLMTSVLDIALISCIGVFVLMFLIVATFAHTLLFYLSLIYLSVFFILYLLLAPLILKRLNNSGEIQIGYIHQHYKVELQNGINNILNAPVPDTKPIDQINIPNAASSDSEHIDRGKSTHFIIPRVKGFVGRDAYLKTITGWYNDPNTSVGALIAWGGMGKSSIAREWYDHLDDNAITPHSIFWWGFYKNAVLDNFLDALHLFFGGKTEVTNSWHKIDYIHKQAQRGKYLIILDGLEVMQKDHKRNDTLGCFNHSELMELVKGFTEFRDNGLMLITSRLPVKDLEGCLGNEFASETIDRLSDDEAREFFTRAKISGEPEEIEQVISNLKGHALSIATITTYVKRYCKGIVCVSEVVHALDKKKRVKKIDNLLKMYNDKMSRAEAAFIKLLSLFTRDVSDSDLEGVFRSTIKGSVINASLIELERDDFIDLVNGLVDWQLVSKDETNETYSTHPLIRNYFEKSIGDEDKIACHKAIYDFIDTYAPERPDTLEEMEPLFEMIYHGCRAGMHDDVFTRIYYQRIHRADEGYLVRKLGAWDTDIGLARNFFPEGDFTKTPLVSGHGRQGWLINGAGLCMKNVGRPEEAVRMLKIGIDIVIKYKDFGNASAGFQNLTDLQIHSGMLDKALKSAEDALMYSEKSANKKNQIASKSYLAYVNFLLGRVEEAGTLFEEADALEKENTPQAGGLYSNRGIWYSKLLVTTGAIDRALKNTKKNLEFMVLHNVINDISHCNRILGMLARMDGNHKDASTHLSTALDIARTTGHQVIEIEALIECGRLMLTRNQKDDLNHATNYLEAALKIIRRSTYILHKPSAEITLAKVRHAQGNLKEARELAGTALDHATAMNYHWPMVEAEEFLKELK